MTTDSQFPVTDSRSLRPVRSGLTPRLTEELKKPSAREETQPAGEPPRLADALLRDARISRATDIHLDPERERALIRFRIDGMVIDVAVVDKWHAQRITNQFKTLVKIDPVTLFAPQASRFTYETEGEELDLRVTLVPCVNGETLTIRLLDAERLHRSIQELGLNDRMLHTIKQWLDAISGMFLVAGPTGTGKTTTLYALLHELKLLEKRVVTIEDPVEYQIDGVTQIQVDQEHGLDFTEGIKTMLRMDPDYLLVGEIRGGASAQAASTIATTGHVLLSTLHGNDPVSAVTALRNWGVEDYEIAASLQIVVAQRLVRRLCPECRRVEEPAEDERRWLRGLEQAVPDRAWHARGCEACGGLGYRGRIGIFELWRTTTEELDLIVSHAGERRLREHLRSRDHATLLADGMAKVNEGSTTIAELRANRVVEHPPSTEELERS
jgi:type II secretory ATPase GspE/PulE/Tfp pilus assembly ATPase PilB-like protein